MPVHATHLESHLPATVATGLALAVTAPYRDVKAADICGAGTTSITTAQAAADNCQLGARESVDVTAAGSIPFTGGNSAIDIGVGAAAGSITNIVTIDVDVREDFNNHQFQLNFRVPF